MHAAVYFRVVFILFVFLDKAGEIADGQHTRFAIVVSCVNDNNRNEVFVSFVMIAMCTLLINDIRLLSFDSSR